MKKLINLLIVLMLVFVLTACGGLESFLDCLIFHLHRANIYSYDIVIKAGIDFEEIEWSEKGKKIEVKLPEVKILSSEINPDSMKIYYEEESIFRQISLEENNEAQSKMRQQAEEDAINSGLLDNARSNAETILRSFFASQYDLQEYEVVFVDK